MFSLPNHQIQRLVQQPRASNCDVPLRVPSGTPHGIFGCTNRAVLYLKYNMREKNCHSDALLCLQTDHSSSHLYGFVREMTLVKSEERERAGVEVGWRQLAEEAGVTLKKGGCYKYELCILHTIYVCSSSEHISIL